MMKIFERIHEVKPMNVIELDEEEVRRIIIGQDGLCDLRTRGLHGGSKRITRRPVFLDRNQENREYYLDSEISSLVFPFAEGDIIIKERKDKNNDTVYFLIINEKYIKERE
jgi:hypothetical protein